MGDPHGPLRRVGLPLTNRHSPGGSWHGGSVPEAALSRSSSVRIQNGLQSARASSKAERYEGPNSLGGCASSHGNCRRQSVVFAVDLIEGAALGLEAEHPEPDDTKDIPRGEIAQRRA